MAKLPDPYDTTEWRDPSTEYCEWCDEGTDPRDFGIHRHHFYVSRDGAASRNADNLAQVFLFDVADILADPDDVNGLSLPYRVPAELAILDTASWCENPDDAQALSDEIPSAESALADAGLYASWDDGYVIERIETREDSSAGVDQ